MNSLLNETFFKIFLVICLIPVAILVGKAFLLLSPILFWVLGYMAFKKGNQNETIMWVIFAVLGLILPLSYRISNLPGMWWNWQTRWI